ncbi:hypothetical protein GF374_01390 [Candidatus Woesearchaeota archaeon]|nr:hypothetical protein [Candidatus Woesearchaeota archaeon]
MKGKVKFFNTMKNFGFIAGDDGKEYFVHSSDVQEGVTLRDEDEVIFDVEEGDRGPKAVNVKKAEAGAEEETAEEKEEESEEAPEEAEEEESEE